ncbi:MAG: BspA family leucine-rich repeat surface protein [Clostridiales bacterium]|nr:BspA family leucine-rich repeat surface protein [Clostridiales bacterium]
MPENRKTTNLGGADSSTDFLRYPTLMKLPEQERPAQQTVEDLEAELQRLLAQTQALAAELQHLKTAQSVQERHRCNRMRKVGNPFEGGVETYFVKNEDHTPESAGVRPGWKGVIQYRTMEKPDVYSLDGVTEKGRVTEIRFLNTLKNAPESAADLSEEKDRGVLCWTEGTVQYIAGEGGVVAGTDCIGLFSGYEKVTAIHFDGNFDTSNVTDMTMMFYDCHALKSLDVSGFNTANVVNMGGMFCNCASLTALDVSGFDTSRVEDMSGMFGGCYDLEALNVTGLDISVDIDMMFFGCSSLKELDVSGFDTSQLHGMAYVFAGCSALTSLDLSGWDTSNVEIMDGMFYGCASLRSLNLSGWDTAYVFYMIEMFAGCTALTDFDPSWLDTSNADTTDMYTGTRWGKRGGTLKPCSATLSFDGVTPKSRIRVIRFLNTLANAPESAVDCSMEGDGSVLCWTTGSVQCIAGEGGVTAGSSCRDLFAKYENVTSIQFGGNFDTSNVTDMTGMFSGCKVLPALDLSSLDTSNVTNMSWTLSHCYALKSLNLSGWNTHQVTNMYAMFDSSSALNKLDLSGFDTSNVTNMYAMFCECNALETLDLSGWDVSRVTNMRQIFYDCKALAKVDLTGWNPASATDMSWMFGYCDALTALNLSGWNTARATDMSGLFCNCGVLKTLNLSGWNTANVKNMKWMLYACRSLAHFDPSWLDTTNADTTDMYTGTSWG